MEQTGGWPKAVNLGVGREVQRWRKARGLSTQELADRCDALGSPLGRSVLAKLESGHRKTVTVVDVVTLGRALNVPPLLLLYPVGREVEVEALPGRRADPWDAAKVFTGEMGDDGDKPRAAEDLGLFRLHDRYLLAWERARDTEAENPPPADAVSASALAEGALLSTRQLMRDRGLRLPPLPPALAALFPAELR